MIVNAHKFTDINLLRLDELVGYSPYPIHLTSEWLTTYVEEFNKSKAAKILILQKPDQEKYFGFLPLEVNESRGTRFFNLRRLSPLGAGPSDFFDIPCIPGFEKEFADCIVNWLKKNRHFWDSLQLDLIPKSSKMWQPLLISLQENGFVPNYSSERRFFYVSTNMEWPDYEKSHFRIHNSDLLKDIRRIERDGIQLRLIDIRSDINSYLPQILTLYGQRRVSKQQNNSFTIDHFSEFLKRVVKKFEQNNMVSLSLLVDKDDRIWAFQLDWLLNGIRYHYSHGFDEQFKEYSPGKILLYLLLKESFKDTRIHQCNFMRGESSYKKNFANRSEAYVSIHVKNPFSARNLLVMFASRVVTLRDRLGSL